ncbi:Catechol 2,3-dioxygenase [Paracoccus isoporae]|uniref:Catechol 2,3-dioxygenase n=1 Tax=Paracoccus isoporae TaxID=591205 RepID=A0A1G7DWV1_9RHOB|nr:VOC family protein [Paracoccus isoporae]SDE55832.1 Catechol 2,3-dioxygenase [Paracoccus isoporae]
MIDHIGFHVSDLTRARAFYAAALAPLGLTVQMEVTEEMTGGHGSHVAFGREGNPFFWIGTGKPAMGGLHVAFLADDEAGVAAFHAAALEAGGTDNGAPGPRPDYHAGYYGAFVIGPDGNNIEAVFHGATP